MKVVSTRSELRAALAELRQRGGRVGLVPTMGALHEGHEALLGAAREATDAVVASIFVNPLQFGRGEDLASYPRPLDDDLARCSALGVDVVFTPTLETVYPGGEPQVTIDPGPLATELEGVSRPGHFRGVLTVVTKLFGLVRPDTAFFGVKDYQQLVLIRQCVTDLCLPVEVVGVETVRERSGLALSSRNSYLSAGERAAAQALSGALTAGRERGSAGASAVLAAAWQVLEAAPDISTDYLHLRGEDLGPAPARGVARLLVAARIGSTRLIDNMAVLLGPDADDNPAQRRLTSE